MAGGVNQMTIKPFFNETVCYNMPISGAPPGSTQQDCFVHTLGQYVFLDGTEGMPPGVYANSSYVGTRTTPGGKNISRWQYRHGWVHRSARKPSARRVERCAASPPDSRCCGSCGCPYPE